MLGAWSSGVFSALGPTCVVDRRISAAWPKEHSSQDHHAPLA